jgi:hypothetical protein
MLRKISINPVLDIETLKFLSNDGVYFYDGPIDDFCSGSSEVQQTETNLMNDQAAMVNTLNTDYTASFGEQQKVLAQQNARLSSIVANPMGYSPQELASMTTSVNENVAKGAQQALGAASAYAAAHGGAADVAGGGAAEIAGQIGASAASTKAQALSAIATQNQQLKRQNLWAALSGLNQVGSAYGGAASTAAGAAPATANSATGAGSDVLEAGNETMGDIGATLSGAGGILTGIGELKG